MFYLCLSLALSVNDNKVLLERGNKKKDKDSFGWRTFMGIEVIHMKIL
jgi:hypothetical protein